MSVAIIRSRVKISPKELSQIKEHLGAKSIKNEIDNSISGGFLAEIGDKILDFTVGVGPAAPGHQTYTVGKITLIGDGVAEADGLSGAMLGEIVEIENKGRGLVLNLSPKSLGIVILGDYSQIKPGDAVKTTGRILSVPVGEKVLGRVIDPLGQPLDGKPEIEPEKYNPLEVIAPGVMARQSVSVPLQTGIKAIDGMIPIGRGQRELIIGDRQTGKSSIALSTIINQKHENMVCVYVAIGQKRSNVAQFIAILEKFGAMSHTVVVTASASDSPAMQYLAPYAGCAIGEYFLQKGKDALVIYDDLSKHSWAYRQISLLLRRPSGREAYPGDIFYAHSRLLERSCRLNQKSGGGSLTALPIIETQAGDLSAYIPTNVISITDGQIYLESDLFNAGQKPAINVGNSVSRVGGAAQIKAIKQVAGRLRLDLAQYRELQAFAQFASDLDDRTKKDLNRGAKLTELLKQGWDEPMAVEKQVVSIWAGTNGILDDLELSKIKDFESHLLDYVDRHNPEIFKKISSEKIVSPETAEKLAKVVKDAKQVFVS